MIKLNKKLICDGKSYVVIHDDVRLFLSATGKAEFVVQSESHLSGTIVFMVGYAGMRNHAYFAGNIERSEFIGKGELLLRVRELTAELDKPANMALRHCSMKDVLVRLSELSNLVFSVPNKDYSNRLVGQFFSNSSGIYCLNQLGKVFEVDDFCWFQLGDGRIFVGDWEDSIWSKKPLEVDTDIKKSVNFRAIKRYPVMPSVRPGALFNNEVVSSVAFSGTEMVIKCETP